MVLTSGTVIHSNEMNATQTQNTAASMGIASIRRSTSIDHMNVWIILTKSHYRSNLDVLTCSQFIAKIGYAHLHSFPAAMENVSIVVRSKTENQSQQHVIRSVTYSSTDIRVIEISLLTTIYRSCTSGIIQWPSLVMFVTTKRDVPTYQRIKRR